MWDLDTIKRMNNTDPNEIDQHSPGAKLDAGKNRLGLVLGEFAHALWDVGEVGTFGASKYSPRGWLSVPDAKERYMDALMRHLMHHFSGEDIDPESGLKHLAHAAWNILAVLDLEYRTLEIPEECLRKEREAWLHDNGDAI